MDVSSHTSWLSLDLILPYYYLNSYVIRNLNLHFGLFPSRHTTLSSYVWNYHLYNTFLSLTHIDTHLYALFTSLVYISHDTHGVSESKNYACESLLYSSCSLFVMIGHALTCFADNQLSRRSISFSLLKSTHQRLL